MFLFGCAAVVFARDPVLCLADSLFDAGEYDASITEYKRYLFFNPSAENRVYALSRVGKAFRELGDFSRAKTAFLKAAESSVNTADVVDSGLQIVLLSLRMEEYAAAEFELFRLASLTGLSPFTRRKIMFHEGILYLYTSQWEKARNAFGEAFADEKDTLTKIVNVLEAAKKVKLRSPTAAKILSSFLPGLGQTYGGKPLQGLNALILNGGIFFLFGFAIAETLYAEAVLTFFYLVLRYYPGNIYQAGQKAQAWNDARQAEYRGRILNILAGVIED